MARLGPNEQILWQGTRAWSDFGGHWLGVGLLLFVGFAVLFHASAEEAPIGWILMGVSLFLILAMWLGRLRRQYTLTSQRAVSRWGVLSHRTYEVEIKDIVEINMSQTLWQRFWGTGTLWLRTASGAKAAVFFRGVSDPEDVKEMIHQQRRESS